MSRLKNLEFTGEVFVGIDVHRESYTVVELIESEVVKKTRMPGNPERLIKYLKNHYPKAQLRTVYEAGFSGFVLHRELTACGINNIIVNPSSIAVESKDRVKTDKRDATKMAKHLSLGLLRGIRIPTPDEEQNRLAHRTRRQLVQDRVRMIARVRMRLIQFGLFPEDLKTVLTYKSATSLIADKKVPEKVRLSLYPLLTIWKELDVQIKQLNRQFLEIAKVSVIVQTYLQVPGIGIQTATVLATELGDMSQFRNEKALFNFLGLTPCEFSSGESIRRGRISRQGNARIRGLLVESAWVAIGKDPVLRQAYSRIAAGKNGKKAIVAIARKLSGRARTLFRKQTNYEINYTDTKIEKAA
jgi:transposase